MEKITDFEKFDRENAYDGNDLGVIFVDGKTQFRTWSPMATAVYLNLYTDGEGDNLIETLPLERHWHGVWLSLIHISEPTRLKTRSRMPSSA